MLVCIFSQFFNTFFQITSKLKCLVKDSSLENQKTVEILPTDCSRCRREGFRDFRVCRNTTPSLHSLFASNLTYLQTRSCFPSVSKVPPRSDSFGKDVFICAHVMTSSIILSAITHIETTVIRLYNDF